MLLTACASPELLGLVVAVNRLKADFVGDDGLGKLVGPRVERFWLATSGDRAHNLCAMKSTNLSSNCFSASS